LLKCKNPAKTALRRERKIDGGSGQTDVLRGSAKRSRHPLR
jgi:hypothetical protein